jgi:hypothetical protein
MRVFAGKIGIMLQHGHMRALFDTLQLLATFAQRL